MELKGKVIEIGDTLAVTDTFNKRELVVEYADNPQYPEFIKFEAIQDKCALFDELRVGDNVEVFFNIKGRPWTNKTGVKQYFNTLQVWKLNISQTVAEDKPIYASDVITSAPAEDDDLPF